MNSPTLQSNLVYNDDSMNLDTEYGGIPDRTGTNGNISGLPRFCDRDLSPPQLGLNTLSPCLGAGVNGGDIGAHQGADCNVVISVEPTTWSRIKSYYR